MSFTAEETAYLRSKPLARVATLSTDGQPDVVPVAFEFDGECFWVGGSGASVLTTRRFRNVAAGNHDLALVVDDMVSFDPLIARGIRIYGHAEQPIEREGLCRPWHLHADHTAGLLELEHGRRSRRRHVVSVAPRRSSWATAPLKRRLDDARLRRRPGRQRGVARARSGGEQPMPDLPRPQR